MSAAAPKLTGAAADLDEVLGGASRSRSVTVRGEAIEVKPMTVRQIRLFLPHARPLMATINGLLAEATKLESLEGLLKADTLLRLIEEHGDNVIAAAGAAVDREPEWIDDAMPDELLELVTKIVSVNLDFFVHRLIPGAGSLLRDLAGEIRRLPGVGRTASKRSSAQDTD